MRGLSQRLNLPQGRVYQRDCAAILGDGRCGVDLSNPTFSLETRLVRQTTDEALEFADGETYPMRWFERGVLEFLDGEGRGLKAVIKTDLRLEAGRKVFLSEPVRAAIVEGDRVRLVAGCDKRFGTCRAKFNNTLNFQGFPHIPGDDWLMSYPSRATNASGGALR